MLISAQKLTGAQVVSLHTGQIIGKTTKTIIDPNQLAVVGFYCEIAQKRDEPLVLIAADIRQATAGRLFINSFDELTEPAELIRLKTVLNLQFNLISKPVRTPSHGRLGKVEDYAVETTSWMVQKLYVHQSLLKSFSTNSLVIDRVQIIEVTDRDITVNDAVMTKPAVVPQRIG